MAMLAWESKVYEKRAYSGNAKITAALRVDWARLEEGLALRGTPSEGDGGEGHDSDNSGFEELHFGEVDCEKWSWVTKVGVR